MTDVLSFPSPDAQEQADELKVVCGWCGATLREGGLPVSHGICAACKSRLEAQQ